MFYCDGGPLHIYVHIVLQTAMSIKLQEYFPVENKNFLIFSPTTRSLFWFEYLEGGFLCIYACGEISKAKYCINK